MTVKDFQPRGFSDRLYKSWIASGVTMADLSRITGIYPNTLYSYLYYGVTPNVTKLARLCAALHVSADYLLFGKGNDPETRYIEPKRAKIAVRYITLNGETHSVTEWSKILKLSRSTIHYRLGLGLSPEEVLKTKCNI